MICDNWQNYIFNTKGTIINSIKNASNIFDEIDSK